MLRGYQAQLKADIYDSWSAGEKNTLAVLPTGGGKSVVIKDIVKDFDVAGENQAVIAHRNELVSQLSGHLASVGVFHRLIAPQKTVTAITRQHRDEYGRSFVNPDARAAVIGVDTLIARRDDLKSWAHQVNRWHGDEAHHFLQHNKWGAAVEMFPNAYGLGVTASPCRADGYGLGSHHDGVFDNMVQGPTMRELIDVHKALSDYQIAIPQTDFVISDDAITGTGEFSAKRMQEASENSHMVGDVVTQYCIRALGKRAIVFAINVKDAQKIAETFNTFGIPAAAISGKSDDAYRTEMVKRFRDGRILVLVNVDLFGEGFDVPACEVVIMARPTASLGVYLQQFGRALRLFEGKEFGLIIDPVSNVIRHGLPDKPHFWTLDRREKRSKKTPDDPDEIPLTPCKNPECARPYEAFRPYCPHCGFAPPIPEASERTIPQVEGDLILLTVEMLERMRKATELPSPAAIGSQAAYAGGMNFIGIAAANRQIEKITAQTRLRDAIDQWAGYERAAGFSDQEIYRKFYLTLGFTTLDAMHIDRNRADYDKTAETVEGWFK